MQTNQSPGEQSSEPVLTPDAVNMVPAEPVTLEEAPPLAEPAAAPPERQLSRHEQQMREIAVRRREAIDAELAEARKLGMESPPLGAETPDPLPPSQEPQEPQATPTAAPDLPPGAAPPPGDEPPPAAPTVRTHRILVNGRQIEMPEADLYRAAERGVYADASVRHANQILEEARRVAAASGQPIPGGGPSPASAVPTAQSEPSGLDPDAARELARELLYGDEEKVAEALQRIAQPRQPAAPAIDPNRIAEDVINRVNGTRTLENALETFGREYQDIVADVDLTTLTAQYVQAYRQQYAQTGTPRTELDLFREAGNAVRGTVDRIRGGTQAQSNGGQPTPAPQPAAMPAANNGARIAIKRATPQAPAAASAPQEPATPQLRSGMTPSETVAWMKRTRGQPVSVQ
jgi:hypothetical protein